ncbi:MAG TPA: cyanophycin synthetase, partial [Pirellulaceae bacterium]
HMLEGMFRACGYQTGLYTSPHLVEVEERIVRNGRKCSAEELVELTQLIHPVVRALDREYAEVVDGPRGPTYFEILTAMAFLHFARKGVEVAVMEVGLGGRLDSTNICLPVCGVVTSISRDHVRQLGSTLAAIAREKAGIIKPGVPMVSGVARGPAREVIEATAHDRKCPLRQLGQDFRYRTREDPQASRPLERFRLEYVERDGPTLRDIQIGMLGRHQHANAAVALATRSVLLERGWNLPEDACRKGLAAARGRARVELIHDDPATVLDVAHNEASISALLATLREHWPERRLIVIFAATRGKEIRAMLRRILAVAGDLVITRYQDNPRSESPESLVAIAEALRGSRERLKNCRILSQATPRDAWNYAQTLRQEGDVVCITGSFFLAAELLPLLDAERNPATTGVSTPGRLGWD